MLKPAGDERSHWLRLASIPGLGASRQRNLLAAFGLPHHIFNANRSALAAVVGRESAESVRVFLQSRQVALGLACSET